MISCMLVKLKIFGLGINKKSIIDIFKTPIYLKFSIKIKEEHKPQQEKMRHIYQYHRTRISTNEIKEQCIIFTKIHNLGNYAEMLRIP